MHSRARPLIGRSLRRWRIAEAQLRRTLPGTPERETASRSASAAEWRYFHLVARSMGRLSAVSSDIIVATHQLRAAELERSSSAPGSAAARAAAAEVVELSVDLFDLATEEVILGAAIGPTDMSIEDVAASDSSVVA
jgi:hypothetical protein